MAIAADTSTKQRFTEQNDQKKSSNTVQPPSDKKSHIHEHPFMKEVCFDYSIIVIIMLFICSLSFSFLQVV